MSNKVCKGFVFKVFSFNMDPENMEIDADFEGVEAYTEFKKSVAL